MNKVSALIVSVIMVLATFTGASAQASQPVSQPVVEAPTFDTFYLGSAAQWGAESLSNVGITLAPSDRIAYTNVDNCGATGLSGLGGCTHTFEDGSHLITISPELKYTAWGNHILFHEYAHTLGYGECAAEAYAHVIEGNADLWSYPECEEM